MFLSRHSAKEILIGGRITIFFDGGAANDTGVSAGKTKNSIPPPLSLLSRHACAAFSHLWKSSLAEPATAGLARPFSHCSLIRIVSYQSNLRGRVLSRNIYRAASAARVWDREQAFPEFLFSFFYYYKSTSSSATVAPCAVKQCSTQKWGVPAKRKFRSSAENILAVLHFPFFLREITSVSRDNDP